MTDPRRKPIQPEIRAELAALVAGISERRAREIVGLTAETYARVLAGLPVHVGTRKIVDEGIARLRDGRAA